VALNMKLSTGWNPYFVGEDSRLYTPLKEVAIKYLDEIKRNIRPDTCRSYTSFVSIFCEWMEKTSPNIYSSMVTHALVAKFMDYVYNERKGRKGEGMSNKTYNNYIKNGSAFFSWMIDKCYCKENHFTKVKSKKKENKIRILIPEETREKITKHLLTNNPNYLLMLKLIYNSLIRPKEIRGLYISDISIAKGQITVRKEVAKNGKERVVPMTPDLIKDFIKLNLQNYASNYYAFGKEFNPSKTPLTDFYMHKYWAKMRKKLELPEEMQQYSLRDSGIFEMLKKGIDPLSVKQLADHHSLEMTTIYSNHIDPNLQKIIVENAPKFARE
jgi:site-specific recombinase XerD